MIYPVKQQEKSPYDASDIVYIRLRKLEEVPDAAVPNNKPVGYVREGYYLKAQPPKVGECFWVFSHSANIRDRGLRTSTVQEILDERTFRTHNSVYQFEVLGEPGNHAWEVEQEPADPLAKYAPSELVPARVTKLGVVDNPYRPEEVHRVKPGDVYEGRFHAISRPTVGQSFSLSLPDGSLLYTTHVLKVQGDVFETRNSRYRIELL